MTTATLIIQILTMLFFALTFFYNTGFIRFVKVEFVCNDTSNSNGYVSKGDEFLLIEVECKIRNLRSTSVSIDSYSGLYYFKKIPYPYENRFIKDQVNKAVIENVDYFKVPFLLAPWDQKNVNLFIQIPIAYKDRNKGLSECSPNESAIDINLINNCFIDKLKRPIPNYLYETIEDGNFGVIDDIGLRVNTSDGKYYDSKVTFNYIAYRLNESIFKLSSDRIITNVDQWFIKKIKNARINTSEYIDLRYVIGHIIISIIFLISYALLRFKYMKIYVKHKKAQMAVDILMLSIFLIGTLSDLFALLGLNIVYLLLA